MVEENILLDMEKCEILSNTCLQATRAALTLTKHLPEALLLSTDGTLSWRIVVNKDKHCY